MRRCAALIAALLLGGCVTTDMNGVELPDTQPNYREAARINTELGNDYARNGQYDLALDKLKRALSQDPNRAQTHTTIAYVYSKLDEPALAEAHYRKALSLDPNDSANRNNFGTFLCSRGKGAEAEKYFLQAAGDKRYATREVAWTNAGVCARKVQDMDKADRYFREALQLNPEFPDALAQMAWLSLQKGDFLRARAFLQRYEKNGRPTAEALWIGARTEAALGDAAAARDYETRLQREFPESEESRRLLSTPSS